MPLRSGSDKATVSANIREMVAAGHPVKQAIAAALGNARRHAIGGLVNRRFADGGLFGGAGNNLFQSTPGTTSNTSGSQIGTGQTPMANWEQNKPALNPQVDAWTSQANTRLQGWEGGPAPLDAYGNNQIGFGQTPLQNAQMTPTTDPTTTTPPAPFTGDPNLPGVGNPAYSQPNYTAYPNNPVIPQQTPYAYQRPTTTLTQEEMNQFMGTTGLKGQAFLDALPAPMRPTGVTDDIRNAYNTADAAFRANPTDPALRDALRNAGEALNVATYGPYWQLYNNGNPLPTQAWMGGGGVNVAHAPNPMQSAQHFVNQFQQNQNARAQAAMPAGQLDQKRARAAQMLAALQSPGSPVTPPPLPLPRVTNLSAIDRSLGPQGAGLAPFLQQYLTQQPGQVVPYRAPSVPGVPRTSPITASDYAAAASMANSGPYAQPWAQQLLGRPPSQPTLPTLPGMAGGGRVGGLGQTQRGPANEPSDRATMIPVGYLR